MSPLSSLLSCRLSVPLLLSCLLGGCGFDTAPAWYHATGLPSPAITPYVDADDNIVIIADQFVYSAPAVVSQRVVSRSGQLVSEQSLDFGILHPYTDNTHRHARDDAGNLHLLVAPSFLASAPDQLLYYSRIGLDGTVQAQTTIEWPEGFGGSFSLIGSGDGDMLAVLQSRVDRDHYTWIWKLAASGQVAASLRLQGTAAVIGATPDNTLVLRQLSVGQHQLVLVDIPSLRERRRVLPQDLAPGMGQALWQAVVSDTGSILVMSQHASGDGSTPASARLSVLDTDGDLLRSFAWPDAELAGLDGTAFFGLKLAAVTDSLTDDADLLIARKCSAQSCGSAQSSFRFDRVSSRDGSRVWRSSINIPSQIPLAVDGGLILRLPETRNVSGSELQAFAVMHDQVWVQLEFSYAQSYFSSHFQDNLYRLDPATGTSRRQVSTYREISSFVVNGQGEIVTTITPYETISARQGLMLFK